MIGKRFPLGSQRDIEDIVPLKKYQHEDSEVLEFVHDLITSKGLYEQSSSSDDLEDELKLLRKKYHINPSKTQMRTVYEKNFSHIKISSTMKRWLIKRVMRSESGVIVVTIVTKPGDDIKFSCPEKCAYCPTETDLLGNPTQPKSYITSEPAMHRAARNNFVIREQIVDRVRSYLYTGNIKNDSSKKKIEVILSGGTWDVMPKEYRDRVINEVYWTFNTLGSGRCQVGQSQLKDMRPMMSIEEEKKTNETSIFGVIGLTIETRPDYITKKTLLEYLLYGVTRVQIGVQHTDDDVLRLIKRGCLTKNTILAIRLLKGIGMKVVTHWMPDLPGSSKEIDTAMFNRLVVDPDLQFDDCKIYPCAVIKTSDDEHIVNSEISTWYENGTYKPYSEENIQDLIDVCIAYKSKISPWVRIERLVRDIPTKSIEAGYNKMSHLRVVIQDQMDKLNLKCKCIRCMEIKDRVNLIGNAKLVVRKYEASHGIEYFISLEIEKYYWTYSFILYCIMYFVNNLCGQKIYYSGNNDQYDGLFGFLRLRIDPEPGMGVVSEIEDCGLIREVHVYGISTSVGDHNEKSSQHKGIGQLLVNTAEEIIKTHGLTKSAIIAGIGARDYYYNKCGYERGANYMIKKFI